LAETNQGKNLKFESRNRLTKMFSYKSDGGGYQGGYEGSRSRSPTRPGSAFDFDRFRKDILGAIE
jgi:hypothetical protein